MGFWEPCDEEFYSPRDGNILAASMVFDQSSKRAFYKNDTNNFRKPKKNKIKKSTDIFMLALYQASVSEPPQNGKDTWLTGAAVVALVQATYNTKCV